MSDDGAAVEKKGRGRPSKASSDDVKEPKKRGRSAAEKSPAKKEDGEVPAKRGRGRPKGTKTNKAAKPKVIFSKIYLHRIKAVVMMSGLLTKLLMNVNSLDIMNTKYHRYFMSGFQSFEIK